MSYLLQFANELMTIPIETLEEMYNECLARSTTENRYIKVSKLIHQAADKRRYTLIQSCDKKRYLFVKQG